MDRAPPDGGNFKLDMINSKLICSGQVSSAEAG